MPMLSEQDFERSTKKYWLKNEFVSSFKERIAQHLPALVFQDNGASATNSPDPSDGQQLITSVYFDSDVNNFYEDRVLKKEGATLIRIRWYEGSEDKVYVEQKVHHTTKASIKRRFVMDRIHVDEYLAGTWPNNNNNKNSPTATATATASPCLSTGDNCSSMTLMEELQQCILTMKLKPTIQTTYVRQAFQVIEDASIRITLDTNLAMGLMRGKNWNEQPLKTFSFPYSIVEIKLGGSGPEPMWLTELKHTPALVKMSSFSKYIHGCYSLNRIEKSRKWSPSWWSAVNDDSNKNNIVSSGGGGGHAPQPAAQPAATAPGAPAAPLQIRTTTTTATTTTTTTATMTDSVVGEQVVPPGTPPPRSSVLSYPSHERSFSFFFSSVPSSSPSHAASALRIVPLSDLNSNTMKQLGALTPCICTAVDLGIFDTLYENPMTPVQLAASLHLPNSVSLLAALLDFLSSVKILTKIITTECYTNDPIGSAQYVVNPYDKGARLASHGSSSDSTVISLVHACRELYIPFANNLLKSVKTGKTGGASNNNNNNNNNNNTTSSTTSTTGGDTAAGILSSISALDIIDSVREWKKRSLTSMCQSFILVQAIYVAVKLDIPNVIESGVTDSAELAELIQADEQSVRRLMRFLCRFGIFGEERDGVYGLTPLSKRLLSSSLNSIQMLVLLCGEEYYLCWDKLLDAIQQSGSGRTEGGGGGGSNISPFECAFGKPIHEYCKENKRFNDKYGQDQNSKSIKSSDEILACFDHSRFETIIDVGGGFGSHLYRILELYSTTVKRGILFDTPEVIELARREMQDRKKFLPPEDEAAEAAAANRMEFVSGDFFTSVPSDGDAYVLKKILDGFSDEDCIKILKNIREAMCSSSTTTTSSSTSSKRRSLEEKRVILVNLLHTGNRSSTDNMWCAMKHGRGVRTEQEVRAILATVGFEVVSVTRVRKGMHVIEAKVAAANPEPSINSIIC